jgi:uncharacterized protein (TIGR02246 family)
VTGPVPADRTGRDRMVAAMCASVDAGDADAFAAWFADDARYRFGNGETTIGRDAVRAATAGAAGALPWVRHTVDQVSYDGDQLYCRFTIATADLAGREVELPCVTVIWIDDGWITDYRVHMDLAPAFAGAAA